MREAIAEPLIDAGELPSTARATLTGTDDYNLLHVKVTYPEVRGLVDVIEEHGVLPSGCKVRIYGKYKNVVLLPEETPIEFKADGEYTQITLPEIVGYSMFRLDK